MPNSPDRGKRELVVIISVVVGLLCLALVGVVCVVFFGPFSWIGIVGAVVAASVVVIFVIYELIGLASGFTGEKWRERKRRRSLYRGVCINCGYDLRGNVNAAQCPECGTPITSLDDPID